MQKIKIIAGSTRPGRFGIQPATWLYELAKKNSDYEVELLDLQDFNLPLLDEAVPASQQRYSHDHTKKWSEAIAEADGFIMVVPEYNHSVPAALKNAIDFLFVEWNHKPVSFVSYGSLAGGARSVEHLRGIVGELKMYDLRDQLLLPSYWEQLDAQGTYQFTEQQEQAAEKMIQDLVFWSGVLKDARQKLAKA